MNPAQAAHGPGLIGAFLNVFLFGIMVTQVYFYLSTYKKDRTWIKLYVLFLLFADLVNAIFDIYWLYTDIINHFGDAEALGVADWRIATDPAMVAIIATCVQLFFAWRVKVLTRNSWITALIVVTAIVSCCGGLGTAIAIHFVKFYANFYKFDQIGTIWLISTAVCDTTITLSLSWYLRKHKTGFARTDDVLNKIIRLTIQNGALTAVWAIVDLILFLTIPTGVHLALNLPLAKLYTNSLMSSLNSRAGWKFDTATVETSKGPHSGGKSAPMPEFVNLTTTTGTRPEVMITTECHEMVDMDPDSDPDAKWTSNSSREDHYKTHSVV